MAKPIISLAEARAKGLKRFFTGAPCRNGHITERYVCRNMCIGCMDDYAKRNAARNSAQRTAYNKAHPEQHRAATRKYDEAHREEKNAKTRERYRENKEKKIASDLAWRTANPDRARAIVRNYKARRKAAEGYHRHDDILRIYAAQKGKCALCRIRLGNRYEVDHIVPLKAGGSNWPRNIQILCPDCNRNKNAKDPLDFSREIGLLL